VISVTPSWGTRMIYESRIKFIYDLETIKVRVRFAYEFIQVLETITVIGGI
jgi:hypothetical protein